MVDTNKKLPKHVWDDKEVTPKKGFTTGWQDILGNKEFTYASPSEPEKYSYQKTRASGSYETVHFDQKKAEVITNFQPGEQRGYVAGGKSTQIDGHQDNNTESTHRINVAGDYGTANKTWYHTSTEGTVMAHNRYKDEYVVAASESKSYYGTYGDHATEHEGNWHEGFKKDHVEAIAKNKITMVEGGDYALHVQKGNADTHIAQKGRIYSGSDMLIESKTKITIKVGASTITITPSNITIKSPRIDLNP
jgi:hypothetical protein